MANNNPSEAKDGTVQSYTSMSVGDVEAVGAHCQMAFCHQLDFLPFRCESCKGTFCLDHRTETAHSCSQAGEWARRQTGVSASRSSTPSSKPNILTYEKQCSSPQCKTLIDTSLTPGVHCANCNRTYCLKHRMREDHDCKNLVPLGARPGAIISRERGLAALEKLRAWGASKKAASSSSSSKVSGFSSTLKKITSNSSSKMNDGIAAMNALKRTAKGDDKSPPEKRVYLYVEASADTTNAKYPTGKFFYSKDWSMGRVLDAAAKALQVANVNNRVEGEEEKLRIFHVEGGRLLEFNEKVEDVLKDGNTIVLLRGVGPGVPDLIEA